MMRQDCPLWLGELSPSYVGMLVGVLASLHPIQLPANISGKAVDNGPYTWAPVPHRRGELEHGPGCCGH